MSPTVSSTSPISLTVSNLNKSLVCLFPLAHLTHCVISPTITPISAAVVPISATVPCHQQFYVTNHVTQVTNCCTHITNCHTRFTNCIPCRQAFHKLSAHLTSHLANFTNCLTHLVLLIISLISPTVPFDHLSCPSCQLSFPHFTLFISHLPYVINYPI